MGLLLTTKGILDTGRISVGTLVDGALGRLDLERSDARLRWWSEKLLRDAEVELVVRGRENDPIGEPLVVVSNHQSLYDIPTLFCAVSGRLRMVAKSELFMVPIWGRAMLASGFVRIDRSDKDKAIASLREVGGALLKTGTRVWVAPEGTRSKTGRAGSSPRRARA
jgi:1-acyl-sn-glycerol-3-phosphate acyltransferase